MSVLTGFLAWLHFAQTTQGFNNLISGQPDQGTIWHQGHAQIRASHQDRACPFYPSGHRTGHALSIPQGIEIESGSPLIALKERAHPAAMSSLGMTNSPQYL